MKEGFLHNFYANFPMIKIINLGKQLYLYDAKSNFLAEASEEQLYLIYEFHCNKNTNIVPHDYLYKLLNQNVFYPGGLEKIVPSPDETSELVKNELANQIPRKFSLEITEKCTLRCRYCFYTTGNKRKHSDESMKEETAFRAIDYYFHRYTSSVSKIPQAQRTLLLKECPPNLSWWGGEPFADFKLIKKTKEYIENLDWETFEISKNDIFYSVVTNFTILSDEIIDFLVNNNIYLQVSLDGDQEENDKNRVFPDGNGSFFKVLDNINHIINRYPEYARNHITIQSVLADNMNRHKASNFIKEYFKIYDSDSKILAWLPSSERHEGEFLPRSTDNDLEDNYISNFRKNLSKLNKQNIDDFNVFFAKNRTIYKQLQDLFLLEEQLILDNPKGKKEITKTLSCPLGTDTLFVSKDGRLHCCCKVDQSFPLGDVTSGIVAEKLEKTYNTYFSLISIQCKECWAINFCKICPALVCWNGEFKLPNEEECKEIRKTIERTLIKYIILNTEFESLYSFEKKVTDFRFDSKPVTIKHYTDYEKD